MTIASSQKLLLIEDDIVVGQMYLDRLMEEGYTVFWAKDGRQGTDAVLTGSYNLVILDIMLPAKNGLDVLETIRQNPQLTPLPVIVLSAYPQPENVDRAHSLNAIQFFNKAATTPREIVYEIRKVLGIEETVV